MPDPASRELWRSALDIARRAAQLTPPERGRYVDNACDGSTGLRERVEELLTEEPGRTQQTDSVGDDWIGREVGNYRLLRRIGSGGMGVVFEAEAADLGRRVALKLLQKGLFSEEAQRRFALEIRLLESLDHPNIATLHDAGEAGDAGGGKLLYYAMELVEDASDIVTFCEREQLSVRERLLLFLQVCGAVEYGHQHQVVHRDLKPANLLVDGQGELRVIDYGVARSLDREPWTSAAHTRSGAIVGTLGYMAPEQLAAEHDAVDARTDIYALGLVLYEILTGRPVFDLEGASLVEGLDRVRKGRIPSIPPQAHELRSDLEPIVLRCTRRNPDLRYKSVNALAADVRSALESKTARRRNVWRRALGALALLLTGFLAGRTHGTRWFASPPRTVREPASRGYLQSLPFFPQLVEFAREQIEAFELKASRSYPDVDLQQRIDDLILPSTTVPPTPDVRVALEAIPPIANQQIDVRFDLKAVRAARDAGVEFGLELPHPACLTDVLNLLFDEAEGALGWKVKDGSVFVSDTRGLQAPTMIATYPVPDLCLSPAPALGLAFDPMHPRVEVRDGERVAVELSVNMDDIATQIFECTAIGTWEEEGVSFETGQGLFFVVQTPDAHLEIESFLTAYRRSVFFDEELGTEAWEPYPTPASVRRFNLARRRAEVLDRISSMQVPALPFEPGKLAEPRRVAKELGRVVGCNVLFSRAALERLSTSPSSSMWHVDYDEKTTVKEFLDGLPQAWSVRGTLVTFDDGLQGGGHLGKIYDIAPLIETWEVPSREVSMARERRVAILSLTRLEDLIRSNVSPSSWDAFPENSVRTTETSRLLVVQRPEAIRQIDELIHHLAGRLAGH